jgi:hypothetical protein
MSLFGFSQKIQLQIISKNTFETKIIDSISYKNEFQTIEDANIEMEILINKLKKLGYFDVNYASVSKENALEINVNLGNKTEFIAIEIPIEAQKYFNFNDLKNNIIHVKPNLIEDFMANALKKYDQDGLGFVNLQLIEIEKKNNNLQAKLWVNYSTKRIVNQLVVNGYPKFPKGHLKRLKRSFLNKTYSQELVKKVSKNLDQINFIKQIKYPEVLFKKDSTQIYLYLNKQNNNQFDGFMGFSNNKSGNFVFTGYLDLKLQNIINSGEKLQINWRNDGNNQSSFLVDLALPLLFNTSFGLETSLHVFKKDSLFQNSKTNVKLTYLLPNDMSVGVGLLQNSSNSISKIDTNNLQDFENSFYTFHFNFSKNNWNDILFPEEFAVNFSSGFGNRNTKSQENSQYYFKLNSLYHYKINSKNSLFFNNSNYLLKSDDYLTNELERFGGIYSIRGFQENSLQANAITSISTEYRYRLSPDLYMHSISDFAYFEDATNKISKQIIGLGFGIGLFTKNGLFKLSYATGFEKNQAPSFQNALLHFSFITRF